MDKSIFQWIIGPQLVGFIFIIVGYIQKVYPPKNINKYYGYRTVAAMKTQQTWDEANRYSARFAIKMGVVVLVTGFAFTLMMEFISMPEKMHFALWYLLMLAGAMGSALALIVSTERHLERTFEEHKE